MKYVIIGNSAAAIGAVEGIRRNDLHGKITIISSERHHTYSRPLISYMLMGKVSIGSMKYRNEDFYAKHDCETILGVKVLEIDPVGKRVVLEDDRKIPYDKLLVATGSTPFVPPIPGIEKVEKKHTFTTLDDALALSKDLKKDSRVLVLGAGLIGLKCAEALCKKYKCICVDMSDRVLSSVLDEESSSCIKKVLEENGIELHLGRQVARFDENAAVLDNGMVIDFDVLVVAVGVRPNATLIRNIGGRTNRGVVVNERCETSIEDVYAAGDVCECTDKVSGEFKVMALWPNAYMQGECAGRNMSGEDYVFDKAILLNAVGFFGTHIVTAGNYVGNVYKESGDGYLRKLFFSGNRLNGYILIGKIEKAGIYTRLIREGIPLDMVDDAEMFKSPGLIAFDKNERTRMLGGVV